jgi:hypothetical protein
LDSSFFAEFKIGGFAIFFKTQLFNFLIPMNGVNMKYRFRVFQKKFFYRFSGRIRTFYRRKTGFYEKKVSVALPSAVAVCRDFMAVQMKILSARFLKDAFKLETSTSGSLKELV